MRNSMLEPPAVSTYQFAVYSGAYKYDLTSKPEQPRALFADRAMATNYAASLWPNTFEIVDLWEPYP